MSCGLPALVLLLLGAFSSCERSKTLSAQEVYELVAPAVFVVEWRINPDHPYHGTRSIARGSGVAVSEDLILTNGHVIREFPGLVRVRQGGKRWRAFVSYLDRKNDLCTLVVPTLRAKPVHMSSSTKVKIGERVFAIGAPRGLEMSLSDGLVSGLRAIDTTGRTQVIQTTAPISPGSSGGGLFDSKGRLIGITTAQLEGGQNINFAIPINTISEAISASQTEAHRLLALGIAYMQAGDEQKADEVLQRVTTLAPGLAEAWYLRYYVESLIRVGEKASTLEEISPLIEDGKAFLLEAVKLKPTFAEAWFFLAILYEGCGSTEDNKFRSNAWDEWSKSHKSQSDPLEGVEGLLEMVDKGSVKANYYYEQSRAAIEKAMESDPNNSGYLAFHADVCIKLNRREEALDSIYKALGLNPGNINALYSLFLFYRTAEIPSTREELIKYLETQIEKATKVVECTPESLWDLYVQQNAVSSLITLLKLTGQKDREREYEAKLEQIKDLTRTLLDKRRIEAERSRSEAESALIMMRQH